VLPSLHLKVNKILVTGWLNGDDSYFNRGFQVIRVNRGLAAQAAAGLKEAVADQIVS
jgi:hypothetical protein